MKFNYELLFSEIERKHIPLTHIANSIGMSRQNLHAIKKNDRELSATQVIIICEILGTTIQMFVTREE